MFNKTNSKFERKATANFIEMHFEDKKLVNFFGDSHEAKIKTKVSPTTIRNDAAKQISLLRMEIKAIKKSDKKLFGKVKIAKSTTKHSNHLKAKYIQKNYNLQQKSIIALYRKHDTLIKFAGIEEREFIKEINTITRQYKSRVRSVNFTDETDESKKLAMDMLYQEVISGQEELAGKITIIQDFRKNFISEEEFLKTEIGSKIHHDYMAARASYDVAIESKESNLHHAAQVKSDSYSKVNYKYKQDLLNEKQQTYNKVMNIIDQINNIKIQRDQKIKEITSLKKQIRSNGTKAQQKQELLKHNLIIKKNQNYSFFGTIWAYATYLARSSYYLVARIALRVTFQYRKGIVSKGFAERAIVNRKLGDAATKGSWNQEYFYSLAKVFEEAKEEHEGIEKTNFDKFEYYKLSSEQKRKFKDSNQKLNDKEFIVEEKNKVKSIRQDNKLKITSLIAEGKSKIAAQKAKQKAVLSSIDRKTNNKSYNDQKLLFQKDKIALRTTIEKEILNARKEGIELLNEIVESNKKTIKKHKVILKDQMTELEKFSYKQDLKNKKLSYLAIARFEIAVARVSRRNKQIARLAYKTSIKKSKIDKKDNVMHARYKNELLKKRYDKKDSRHALWNSYYRINKEANNRSEFINKNMPIEVTRGTRFFYAFLNFFFGGIVFLFARQFKKGIFFLALTGFLYGFILTFITGGYGLGGNGLVGLTDLGLSDPFRDARYYIVEGVYSYILLLILIMYVMIMGFSGFRMGLLMEKGMRPNTWFTSKKVLDRVHLPYLLSIPAILTVIFLTIGPLTVLLLICFTDWGVYAQPTVGEAIHWVGFDNFTLLFSGDTTFSKALSSDFATVLGWTLIWGFSTWVLGNIINIAIAALINSERIKFVTFWKTLMVLPVAIPGFIMILLIAILVQAPSGAFEDNGGAIYNILVHMHLWSPLAVDSGKVIVNDLMHNVLFLKVFMIVMSLWFGIGSANLFLSGLMAGISPSLYEAAEVDGATGWVRTKTITLPYILFIIAPMLLPWLLQGLNNFGLIYLFSEGKPLIQEGSMSQAGQTDIMLSWIYKLVASGKINFPNSQGVIAVIGVLFGAVSIAIALPGVVRSKMFREGDW